jgi:hypothetical protein
MSAMTENVRTIEPGANGQVNLRSPGTKPNKHQKTPIGGKRRTNRGSGPVGAKSLNVGSPHRVQLGSSPPKVTPPRRHVFLVEKQPTERYAGPKFSSPPHPSALPPPPSHWLEDGGIRDVVYRQSVDSKCMEIERHLRELLKVES